MINASRGTNHFREHLSFFTWFRGFTVVSYNAVMCSVSGKVQYTSVVGAQLGLPLPVGWRLNHIGGPHTSVCCDETHYTANMLCLSGHYHKRQSVAAKMFGQGCQKVCFWLIC